MTSWKVLTLASLLLAGCQPASVAEDIPTVTMRVTFPVANSEIGVRVAPPSPEASGLPVWLQGDDGPDGKLFHWPNPLDWTWNLTIEPDDSKLQISGDGQRMRWTGPTWMMLNSAELPGTEINQLFHIYQSDVTPEVTLPAVPTGWTASEKVTTRGVIQSMTHPSGRQVVTEFVIPRNWRYESAKTGAKIIGHGPVTQHGFMMIKATYTSPSRATHWNALPEQPAELIIDGPGDDKKHIDTAIRTLRAQLARRNRPSGPFGVTSDRFGGHIFWDADLWVLPACLFLDPGVVKTIADFRRATTEQARRNEITWRRQGRPTARGKMPGEPGALEGVKYAWESGGNGQEHSPTETKFQDHVTASVLRGLDWATAFGLADPAAVNQLGKKAATFYLSRSEAESSGIRHIRNVVSPSELHIANDDLFTNVMAEWCVNRFLGQDAEFARPRDATTFLTFEGDAISKYQQAAALLAIFPAQDAKVEAEATKMYDRFADKVSEFGPAMSDSIHAIVAARQGNTEAAYQDWRQGWTRFTRPNGLFVEKNPTGESIFLTGLAASMNSILYGFLGLRIDRFEPAAEWKLPLKNGYWLSCRPKLPKQWRSITLKNVRLVDANYTFVATHDRLDVTKLPASPEEMPAKRR